jgi:hypothetical protein
VHVNKNNGGSAANNGQAMVRQGVVLLPPKGGSRTFQTGGLPNQPAKQSVTVFPPKNQIAAVAATPALTEDQLMLLRHLADKNLKELRADVPEGAEIPDSVKFVEAMIIAIDGTLTTMTAAAAAAAAPAPAQLRAVAGSRSSQGVASMAPRRIARPGTPPPPVAVKMENGKAIVESAPAVSPVQAPIDVESAEAQG